MPPLHPLVVHFPIVLLSTAGVIYLIALPRQDTRLAKIGFALHVAGLLMSIAAILTGDYEESRIAQNETIHALAETHETLGMLSTWGFGLLGIWAYLRGHSKQMLERIGFLVAFWGLIAVLGYSAHVGGQMVFEHGAGVAPMQQQIEQSRNSAP